eukprot:COSAG02_NODE_30029_length_558_cov_1.326797_1_plen_153_part_10
MPGEKGERYYHINSMRLTACSAVRELRTAPLARTTQANRLLLQLLLGTGTGTGTGLTSCAGGLRVVVEMVAGHGQVLPLLLLAGAVSQTLAQDGGGSGWIDAYERQVSELAAAHPELPVFDGSSQRGQRREFTCEPLTPSERRAESVHELTPG